MPANKPINFLIYTIILLSFLGVSCAHGVLSPTSESQWVYECKNPFALEWLNEKYGSRWVKIGQIGRDRIPQHSFVCTGWSRFNGACDGVVQPDLSLAVDCNKDTLGKLAFTNVD